MNELEQFLKELTELTKKHGYVIGGCGCCGSPFITKVLQKEGVLASDDFEDIAEELRFNGEKYIANPA